VSGGQKSPTSSRQRAQTTNLNLVTSTGYLLVSAKGTGRPGPELYIAPDDTVTSPNDAKVLPRRTSRGSSGRGRRRARKLGRYRDSRRHRRVERLSRNCSSLSFKANNPSRLRDLYGRRLHLHSRPYLGTSALYELKDGAPNLINFQVERGLYIIPRCWSVRYLEDREAAVGV
jgi:hypothetical protein